jgi:hypothetical protein
MRIKICILQIYGSLNEIADQCSKVLLKNSLPPDSLNSTVANCSSDRVEMYSLSNLLSSVSSCKKMKRFHNMEGANASEHKEIYGAFPTSSPQSPKIYGK